MPHYIGDHVDRRICPTCGTKLTKPSEGGCAICWHGTERGLLISDTTTGGQYVHQSCLDEFDVDTLREFEQEYVGL